MGRSLKHPKRVSSIRFLDTYSTFVKELSPTFVQLDSRGVKRLVQIETYPLKTVLEYESMADVPRFAASPIHCNQVLTMPDAVLFPDRTGRTSHILNHIRPLLLDSIHK
jgi:hypothetical protein